MNKIITFFLLCFGLVFGFIAGYIGRPGIISPPARQAQTIIPVTITNLDEKDKWLTGVKAYLVPLANIKSDRRYSILVLTPSADISTEENNPPTSSWLNLEVEGGSEIQPIDIMSSDFGPKGSEIAVKLLDRGGGFSQPYKEIDKLILISSKDH